jgi:hypothetical protein
MVDCAGLDGRRMTRSALPQLKAPPLGMEFSFQAQDHNALAISIVRFLVALPHPGLVTLRQTFARRSQNCVGAAGGRCTAGFQPSLCPLWVKSRQSVIMEPCPLYPQKRTNSRHLEMSALCHKQTSAARFTRLPSSSNFGPPRSSRFRSRLKLMKGVISRAALRPTPT